jgi:maleylacetate reductase
MTPGFTYDARSPRVVFGVGALDRLPEEMDLLGARRVLVLSTPGRGEVVERVGGLLGPRLAGVFAGTRMHVPAEVADAARAEAARLGADCCVSVGGGSATGLGKAVALADGPPLVAIPTTYAGSEATCIWGISAGREKRTGRDPRVLPRAVLYDPALTLSLPPGVAGPSGMNALGHCVEALYAPDANPVTSLLAEEGIRALARSLPGVVRASDDLEARSTALYGAWLAGTALGAVAMGLHHRLCHVLGGSFDLPHAETHAVVLPHAAAFNRTATPAAMERVARALGTGDAPGALYDLAAAVGAPTALREIGMREEDLPRAAARAAARPYPNPRPASAGELEALLGDAFHGRRPRPHHRS